MGVIHKKLINIRKESLLVSLTGFTLIELLVTITIFLIGIMGAFSLSLSNLNNSKENVNRVIAADLAREGIELVRNIRDSNWLAREANISDGSLTTAWDSTLNLSNFNVDYNTNNLLPFTAVVDINTAIDEPEAKLYLNSDGFYTYNSAGSSTIFRRAINLRAICLNTATETETIVNDLDCDALQVKIGYQIISRVKYTYGSKINTIDAVETIYNWRQ